MFLYWEPCDPSESAGAKPDTQAINLLSERSEKPASVNLGWVGKKEASDVAKLDSGGVPRTLISGIGPVYLMLIRKIVIFSTYSPQNPKTNPWALVETIYIAHVQRAPLIAI